MLLTSPGQGAGAGAAAHAWDVPTNVQWDSLTGRAAQSRHRLLLKSHPGAFTAGAPTQTGSLPTTREGSRRNPMAARDQHCRESVWKHLLLSGTANAGDSLCHPQCLKTAPKTDPTNPRLDLNINCNPETSGQSAMKPPTPWPHTKETTAACKAFMQDSKAGSEDVPLVHETTHRALSARCLRAAAHCLAAKPSPHLHAGASSGSEWRGRRSNWMFITDQLHTGHPG